MASALRRKPGVMDYYNMQNVISDTQMRNSISDIGKQDSTPGDKNNILK